jgi:bzd-type benzoyl-CoA reductase N subunit
MNLQQLQAIQLDLHAYITHYKSESGKKIVGYFCSYVPEEIIFAAGALPFRIFGTGNAITLADVHLQSYCCSPVRNALEDALSGNLNFLDGIVFPHTCDSIQRLSDIWRLNVPQQFHIDVVLPVKMNTESARIYMIDILNKFRKELELKLQVKISDDSLNHAISLFNTIRQRMKTIYDMRQENPSLLQSEDFHNIIKSAMTIDRDIVNEILGETIDGFKLIEGTHKVDRRKRIIIMGGICNSLNIYHSIEEAGGMVVWDDLCTGARFFDKIQKPVDNPIETLAERYLTRIICPAKHKGLSTRSEQLLHIIRTKNADGIVFLIHKFCDPHSFDYPDLKNNLNKNGIPTILIEMDDENSAGERLKTRIEAFIETL